MTEHRHSNAIIWLQDGEDEGAADCGCRLINDEDGARFIMCDKHDAAKDMLTALQDLLYASLAGQTDGNAMHNIINAESNANRAIAKATGEDQ